MGDLDASPDLFLLLLELLELALGNMSPFLERASVHIDHSLKTRNLIISISEIFFVGLNLSISIAEQALQL